MAEQAENTQKSSSSKFSWKTILILAGVLLLEAAAIAAVFMLAGQPGDVRAETGVEEDRLAELNEPVEVPAISDKYQNTRTGRSYLYDAEIYVITKRKHRARVEDRIASMEAQLNAEVATIFRRAEPSHLQEPELATLKRQIEAVFDSRLGRDEDGEPYVQEIVIRNLMQFRGDL